MKPSTKRTLGLLASIVLLIAALVIYANLILPSYGDVQQLRGELTAKVSLYEQQQTIITRVKNLLAQFKNSAELQSTISLALPTDEGVTSLIRQVNSIAKAVGVRLDNFSVNVLPFKPNNLGSLQASFQITGSYGAIKNMLRILETNVRVMDLKSVRLDPAGVRPNEDRFVSSIVVEAFYQK